MKLLTILYIFALFVLFSPNIMIKAHKQYFLYSICFSLMLYFTFDFIQYKEFEGAIFNAYDVQGSKYDIEATNVNLGDVQLDNGMSSLDPQSRIIYTEPPKTTENIFTDVPPLFSKYKLENDLEKVMEHGHEEKERLTNVYCAANYGTGSTCCGQPAADVPTENQCPKYKPICSGYVADKNWGQCVSNDDTLPNIQYKGTKDKELCLNNNTNCPAWKQCCPGGKGSTKETKCGTDDCPLNGKPCLGTWMKENCPRTCDLCEDGTQWDGDIGGKYVVDKKVEIGNDNLNHYATIQKSKDNDTYVWKNDNGVTYILQRISNTHEFRVVGDEMNEWTIAKVHLDYNDHVKYIIGPNKEIFVKQS